MSKRKGRRPRKEDNSLYGDGFNSKTEIAKKQPFKLPIIEHLVSDRIKLKSVALVLTNLGMAIKPTYDGRWFDIVEVS